MHTIHITHQPIELYKLLKIESLASSGGEAKRFIAEGLVQVNGEAESRKRRKILHGDIIEFDAESYRVICETELMEEPPIDLELNDDGTPRPAAPRPETDCGETD